MKLKALFCSALVVAFSLISPIRANAERGSAQANVRPVCKPDICQPRTKITKRFRSLIPNSMGLISPKPLKVAKDYFVLENDSPQPQLLVPANRKIVPACVNTAMGDFLCHDVVSYDGCPTTLELLAESPDGNVLLNCELDCEPDVPNSQGLCDCDATSCTPVS